MKYLTLILTCAALGAQAAAYKPFPRFDATTYLLSPSALLSSNVASLNHTNFAGVVYPRTETRSLLLRDLLFFDDFERPNTVPGDILSGDTSPSGHIYTMKGPGLTLVSTNSLHISNGVMRIADWIPSNTHGNAYMRITLPIVPTAVGGRIAYFPGDPLSPYPQGATIAVSSSADGFTKMIHMNNNAMGTVLSMTTNFNSVGLNQYLCTIDPPDLNPTNAFMEVGMEYLGDNILSVWAYGTNLLVRHPWIDEVWGTNVYYQVGYSTNWNRFKCGWDAIWAGVGRRTAPHFSDDFAWTNAVGVGFHTNALRLALSTNAIAARASPAAAETNDLLLLLDASDAILKKLELGSLPTKFQFPVQIGDETTAITAGTAKATWRIPRPFNIHEVRAALTTAQATGNIFTVDININGSSILSTKLTIDNTEKTSTTAATPAVISAGAMADDDELTVDVDQVGDGTATGLKLWLIGYTD